LEAVLYVCALLQEDIKLQVAELLDKEGVEYEVREHRRTFTAQRMAAAEHEPGKYVAKPVVVKADGKYMMCVLGACYKVNLGALKSQLGVEILELAEEEEIGRIFPDCELGAEPPFGNLFELPTIMDKAMEKDEYIVFQAGSHAKAIKMGMADYLRLVRPRILDFSYHTTS